MTFAFYIVVENVVVNFLSQVIFVFLLFSGIVIHANKVKKKRKEKEK